MGKTRKSTSKNEAEIYFGKILKENRLERNMTQEQVAFATGLSPNTISRIELGKVSMKAFTAVLLAELYEIPLNILICQKGLPEENEIIKLQKTCVMYATEDYQQIGFLYISSFNPMTYSFSVENMALANTAKDSLGNPQPWMENMDDLLDKEFIKSRKSLYEKRLSRIIGSRIFVFTPDLSIVINGRIIKADGSKAVVKIKTAYCPDVKQKELA